MQVHKGEVTLGQNFWKKEVDVPIIQPLLARAIRFFPLSAMWLLQLMESLAADAFCARHVYHYLSHRLRTYTCAGPPSKLLRSFSSSAASRPSARALSSASVLLAARADVSLTKDWVSPDGLMLPAGTHTYICVCLALDHLSPLPVSSSCSQLTVHQLLPRNSGAFSYDSGDWRLWRGYRCHGVVHSLECMACAHPTPSTHASKRRTWTATFH